MQCIFKYLVSVGTSDSNSIRSNHTKIVNSIAMAIVISLTVVLTIAQIQYGLIKEILFVIVFFIIPITTVTLNAVKRATLSNYFISFSVPFININELGIDSDEDRSRFASDLLFKIIRRGYKTIVSVKYESDGKDFAYWQNMLEMTNKMGMDLKMFFDYDLAIEYLKEKKLTIQD